MKRLQDYILENYEYDSINEGRIWDALKRFFNNFFKPSKNKKFDRFGLDDNNSSNGFSLINYINNNFSTNNLELHDITLSKLQSKIDFSENEELSNKYYDKDSRNTYYLKYISVTYVSKEVKDMPFVISGYEKTYNNEKYFIVTAIHGLDEYKKLSKEKYNEIIKFIFTELFKNTYSYYNNVLFKTNFKNFVFTIDYDIFNNMEIDNDEYLEIKIKNEKEK